jgi:hypothetical protein
MDTNTTVMELNLPKTLKDFLLTSKSISNLLDDSILIEIEDLYIYYKSFYIFNESEFGAKTIMALKKCKDRSTFYYYLKKILESELDYRTIEEEIEEKDVYNIVKINGDRFDSVVHESTINFINIIDQIYNKEGEINLNNLNKSIGKLELITELTDEEYYKNLLDAAIKVIHSTQSRYSV